MKQEDIVYVYRFVFPDGRRKDFEIKIDGLTLDLITPPRAAFPQWAALSYQKCPLCPLKESEHPQCPAAASLIDIIEFFKDSISCEKVEVIVEAKARTYMKSTALQSGISALIGIYMATSGCPIMSKLKPMVRYHLPFATIDDTRYRAISMYLFAQYFRFKEGLTPDWELKELAAIYNDIRIANKHFSKRLTTASAKDAGINALVKLDCFAIHVSFLIDSNAMGEMATLFKAYTEDKK